MLKGLRMRAPMLGPLLALKWSMMGNVVWQRLRAANGAMTWHRSWAARGGGQGSRLMMAAFCAAVQVALAEADEAMERESRPHAEQENGQQDVDAMQAEETGDPDDFFMEQQREQFADDEEVGHVDADEIEWAEPADDP